MSCVMSELIAPNKEVTSYLSELQVVHLMPTLASQRLIPPLEIAFNMINRLWKLRLYI